MKIIISENRIETSIYNFLNSYYDTDNINAESIRNMDHTKEHCGFEYIIYDDEDHYYDEVIFKLYFETYWIYKNDPKKELSPLLIIEDDQFYDNLDRMFGNRWKHVFKQWFKDNFNEDIKTIGNYRDYWNR